jgi:hypothetical protein
MNEKRAGRTKRTLLRLALILAASFSGTSCRRSERPPEAVPIIARLHPPATVVGTKFQVQPDGQSAIAVAGSNFVKDAKVLFDGRPLETAYGGPEAVTATVPDEYISQPRTIEVRVENPSGKVSDAVRFSVAAGP